MEDIVQIKLELKTWERNFRLQNNGRDPTKDDTKHDPTIAAKYRLYRSLSKQPSNSTMSLHKNSQLKSHVLPTSSLLSISREPPLPSPSKASSSNPFSPVKKRASTLRRHLDLTSDDDGDSLTPYQIDVNPFLVSPSKNTDAQKSSIFSNERSTHRIRSAEGLFSSPDVLPRTRRSPVSTGTNTYPEVATPRSSAHIFVSSPQNSPKSQASMASSALSASTFTPRTKARKRMRGEDVPMTPSNIRRNKRTRPGPASRREGSDDGSHSFDGDVDNDMDVDLPESPVKGFSTSAALTNSSSDVRFRSLFEHKAQNSHARSDSARSAPAVSSVRVRPTMRQTADADSSRTVVQGTSIPVTYGRDDTRGTESLDEDFSLPLYPPSLPTQGNITVEPQSGSARISRKQKTKANRNVNNDDASPENADVTYLRGILPWSSQSQRKQLGSDEEDFLPEFQTAVTKVHLNAPGYAGPENPQVQIDLPSELRRALSISSRETRLGEEKVKATIVQRLLEGRPDTNGDKDSVEVWGAGEWGNEDGDWESEPDSGWNASPDE